jgi:hypothetical protein
MQSLPSDPVLETAAHTDKAKPAGNARAYINAMSMGYLIAPL